MGSKSSDKVDYRGAALAEGEMSRDNLEAQTHANRIDQYNPWGNVDYTATQGFDTNGKPITHWRQDTTLAAPLDRALDEQMNMQMNRSRVANAMTSNLLNEQKWQNTMGAEDFAAMEQYEPAQNFKHGQDYKDLPSRKYGLTGDTADAEQMQRGLDFSGAPQLGGQNMMKSTGFQDPGLGGQNLQTDLDYSGASAVGNSRQIRNEAEDAIYDRGSQRLDRRMEQATNDMEIKLRGQGLQPGDESYDRAMTDLNNQKTDAYQALSNEAIMGGGQEATRDFGMQMDRRGMMTGETDRQGEYRNAALSGQFGIDAQRQAQMQQVAQAEAGFGNEARGQQFGIDAQRRAQSTGETGMMGDYANQAGMQQYGMNQGAAQQRFEQAQAGSEFRNQARDQGINEEMIISGENRSRNREIIDQRNRQRQQAIDENARFRAQGMNEVTAWMQGQQVQAPQFQQYNQAGVAQTPQLLQAAGMRGQENAAMDSADNAMMNSLMGGMGSAAGGAMMMSDRRLKKNIKRIGTKQGHAWYSFRYIWGVEGEGVMADEIPAEFRVRMGDHDMVNYGELFA